MDDHSCSKLPSLADFGHESECYTLEQSMETKSKDEDNGCPFADHLVLVLVSMFVMMLSSLSLFLGGLGSS